MRGQLILNLNSYISEGERGKRSIKNSNGCKVIDERDDGGYSTPVKCSGTEGNIYFPKFKKKNDTVEYGLNIWVFSQKNLRKGAL
ncbi:MAG: hypothetical protein CM15mP109_04370 [Candidatus Dadabacteria bacterium]|nr:MAG: hypothetical protein CM15mP109_04370 [Candidatus Dadabacteria bacterium]